MKIFILKINRIVVSWFSLAVLIFYVCGFACAANPVQLSYDSILNRCHISLAGNRNLPFTVDFEFKFFSEDDTTVRIIAKCTYARDGGDSILGAKIKFDFGDAIGAPYMMKRRYTSITGILPICLF